MQKSYKCLLFRKRLKSLIDLQSFNSVSNEFQANSLIVESPLTAGTSKEIFTTEHMRLTFCYLLTEQ